jgi:hypothetical protein
MANKNPMPAGLIKMLNPMTIKVTAYPTLLVAVMSNHIDKIIELVKNESV